jgi:hypothetical protein
MGLTLSKKYGVNPSVETCAICGNEMGVLLFGNSYKDENGHIAEAPYKLCLGNICDDCKKTLSSGGIFFIEVEDGESGRNPFRTGRMIAIKEDAVKKIFKKYEKVNYVEHSLYNKLFSEPL